MINKKVFTTIMLYAIVAQPTWTTENLKNASDTSFSILTARDMENKPLKERIRQITDTFPNKKTPASLKEIPFFDNNSQELALSIPASPISSLSSFSFSSNNDIKDPAHSHRDLPATSYFFSNFPQKIDLKNMPMSTSVLYDSDSSSSEDKKDALTYALHKKTHPGGPGTTLLDKNQEKQSNAKIEVEKQDQATQSDPNIEVEKQDQATQSNASIKQDQATQSDTAIDKPKDPAPAKESSPQIYPAPTISPIVTSTNPMAHQGTSREQPLPRQDQATQSDKTTEAVTQDQAKQNNASTEHAQQNKVTAGNTTAPPIKPGTKTPRIPPHDLVRQKSIGSQIYEYFSKLRHLIQRNLRKLLHIQKDDNTMNQNTKKNPSTRPSVLTTILKKIRINGGKNAEVLAKKLPGQQHKPFMQEILAESKKMVNSFASKFREYYRPALHRGRKMTYAYLSHAWDNTLSLVKKSANHVTKILTKASIPQSGQYEDFYSKPLAYANLSSRKPEPSSWYSSKKTFSPLKSFEKHSNTLGGSRKIQLSASTLSYGENPEDRPSLRTAKRLEKDLVTYA
jgi:hypothetical protein